MLIGQYIRLYILTLPIFFGVDLIWLGIIAKDFYQKHLGFLLRPSPNWLAAGLFYLWYIFAIVYFALAPNLKSNSLAQAVITGAILGITAYATYDLSNLATLKDWPIIVVVVDILWGMVLTGVVTAIAFLVAKRIGLG